ncbi:hypothetical protein [Vibrio hyugaensis]|uniref:hypothetical protein n=1 Tax=Vibrio hyugaensis TaxID=1534743 RepID=UPI0012E01483|nr:hypothetical protein [Vibrio hyugaensis]
MVVNLCNTNKTQQGVKRDREQAQRLALEEAQRREREYEDLYAKAKKLSDEKVREYNDLCSQVEKLRQQKKYLRDQ